MLYFYLVLKYLKQVVIKSIFKNIHPGVDKPVLVILAGLLWLATGIMLITMAVIWLGNSQSDHTVWFAIAGLLAGLFIHHFGFLRIVDKNLSRIRKIDGKYCLFGFMPIKSYLLIALMMTMGILLKHSPLLKEYLSVLYLAIGTALVLSSARYFHNIRKYGKLK